MSDFGVPPEKSNEKGYNKDLCNLKKIEKLMPPLFHTPLKKYTKLLPPSGWPLANFLTIICNRRLFFLQFCF